MKRGPIILALCAAMAIGVQVRRAPEFMDAPPARVAWNDCGGKGASGSMKMRTLAAKLEGAAEMPRDWTRNAGQDCMETSEDGNHTPHEGHNGFDPPAVVHNRVCAAYDDAECNGDDNCTMVDGACTYNRDKHHFDHDVVFPADRELYSKTELALGRAEEVTHAGIVELNIHGKHAGMEKVRAKADYEDFGAEEATMSGMDAPGR